MKVKSILLVLVGLSGCGRPDADPGSSAGDPSVSLQTDSTQYTLQFDDPGWETTVGFTYHAEADTVYIVNCNGEILMNLQKLEPQGWTDAWYAEGNQCLSPPIVVLPADVYRSEVHISGAERGNGSYNTFRVPEIEGEYRLVWNQPVHHSAAGTGTFGDTIPLAKRVSSRFRLERGDAER